MTKTRGQQEVTQRVINVLTGSEFKTDLTATETRYIANKVPKFRAGILEQPKKEGHDVFRYPNFGAKQFPGLWVLWNGDAPQEYGRNDTMLEEHELEVIFSVRNADPNLIVNLKSGYADAAKRTLMRAVPDGAEIYQCVVTATNNNSDLYSLERGFVSLIALDVAIRVYTTTEVSTTS